MKLCRIETPDGIKPAMIDADGAARDLTQHLTDIELATMAPAALDQLRDVDVSALPVITGRAKLLRPCGRSWHGRARSPDPV